MTMRKFFAAATLVLSAAPFAQAARQELKTVSAVNMSRYAGTWYEIARNNFLPWEWGCVCSRQVLTPTSDGGLDVYNSCNFWSAQGRLRGVKGTAVISDKSTSAKLKLDFNMPWKGNYWIIALDPEYRWAVVSDPSRWSLYIISRTPQIDAALYNEAVAQAATQTDVRYLQVTQQLGCSYP